MIGSYIPYLLSFPLEPNKSTRELFLGQFLLKRPDLHLSGKRLRRLVHLFGSLSPSASSSFSHVSNLDMVSSVLHALTNMKEV